MTLAVVVIAPLAVAVFSAIGLYGWLKAHRPFRWGIAGLLLAIALVLTAFPIILIVMYPIWLGWSIWMPAFRRWVLWRYRNRLFFFYSSHADWGSFIESRVVPVLPDDCVAIRAGHRVRRFTDVPARRLPEQLGLLHAQKPFLLYIRRFQTRVVSLHDELRSLKVGDASKDVVLRETRKALDEALQRLRSHR